MGLTIGASFSFAVHVDLQEAVMESSTYWQLVLLLFIGVYVSTVSCFPTGAPSSACSSLSPNQTSHEAVAQNSSVPYEIDLSDFRDPNTGDLYYTPTTTYQSKYACSPRCIATSLIIP